LKLRNSNPTGRTDGPRKGAANPNFYTTPGDATKEDLHYAAVVRKTRNPYSRASFGGAH